LLSLDSPIAATTDAQSVLQTYADRLSEYVMKKPWQWMALPVIQQYGERCSKDSENILTTPTLNRLDERLNKFPNLL